MRTDAPTRQDIDIARRGIDMASEPVEAVQAFYDAGGPWFYAARTWPTDPYTRRIFITAYILAREARGLTIYAFPRTLNGKAVLASSLLVAADTPPPAPATWPALVVNAGSTPAKKVTRGKKSSRRKAKRGKR